MRMAPAASAARLGWERIPEFCQSCGSLVVRPDTPFLMEFQKTIPKSAQNARKPRPRYWATR